MAMSTMKMVISLVAAGAVVDQAGPAESMEIEMGLAEEDKVDVVADLAEQEVMAKREDPEVPVLEAEEIVVVDVVLAVLVELTVMVLAAPEVLAAEAKAGAVAVADAVAHEDVPQDPADVVADLEVAQEVVVAHLVVLAVLTALLVVVQEESAESEDH